MLRYQVQDEPRWRVIVAAVVIQICLGAIYSWGVFLKPIMNDFGWHKTETSLAFTIFLGMYALGMIIGGRWQDQTGPVRVVLAGGVLLGTGYILAGFTQSLLWLYITYGIFGGVGVGLGYIGPVSACAKWFPDKKGLATGLAVAGFGAGSLIFSPLATQVITVWGWRTAFFGMGTLFIILIVGMSRWLSNPPAGWCPAGLNAWEPKEVGNSRPDLEWSAMIKTLRFWILWFLFMLGASSGLMIIGHLAAFVQESGYTTQFAAMMVGLFALTNGTGRVLWGMVADRYGAPTVLTWAFVVLGVSILSIAFSNTLFGLITVSLTTGIGFGGMMSLFPVLSGEYFGTRNLGFNYGLLFTAYGFAGLVGPVLGAALFESYGNYYLAFTGAGITCIAAALVNRGQLLVYKQS